MSDIPLFSILPPHIDIKTMAPTLTLLSILPFFDCFCLVIMLYGFSTLRIDTLIFGSFSIG